MEENNPFCKSNKVLLLLLILITIVHVIYASILQRGVYLDGAMHFVVLLNGLSSGKLTIAADPSHTRYLSTLFMQLPTAISYSILGIKSKYLLSVIFSMGYFAIPPLLVWWNYKLTQRTKRYDIFTFSLITYTLSILLFQIFAIVELGFTAGVCFLLYNYLTIKEPYSQKDIYSMGLLSVILFNSHEFILFVGPILFIAALFHASEVKDEKQKQIKFNIGLISLIAGIFVLLFILMHQQTQNETGRFFGELIDLWGHYLILNTSLSITAVIVMCATIKKQQTFSIKEIAIISAIFIYALYRLFSNINLSLDPMLEQHTRVVPCILVPILLLFLLIIDFSAKKISSTILSNILTIAIICGIAQTAWQMNNTYWWGKNVKYLKTELQNSKDLLYIPEDHEEISSFYNKKLRRYIWHFSYAATSLTFADTYEIKTLLSHYNTDSDPGNMAYRDWFALAKNKDYFWIPTVRILRKNKFWDAQKATEELGKYNKQNKIQTIRTEPKQKWTMDAQKEGK